MVASFFSTITALIAEHPHFASAAVLLSALSESVPVIGAVVPGTAAILAISALVPTGIVTLCGLLGAAVIGAIFGDGLSFWIGYRYNQTIIESWPADIRSCHVERRFFCTSRRQERVHWPLHSRSAGIHPVGCGYAADAHFALLYGRYPLRTRLGTVAHRSRNPGWGRSTRRRTQYFAAGP